MSTETMTSQTFLELEDKYGAHNYHPLPVVLSKGEGIYVWDVDGKRYFDFLSAYSAVNQGHCHPRIINALIEQSRELTLTSRAFYNDQLGVYEKFVTEYFGYDKVLPINTGVEAVETALKLCRKWAYKRKGIEMNDAKIIFFSFYFHGRTLAVISASVDPDARKEFGPYMPGIVIIPYNDTNVLREALKDPNVAGFIVEPIQGVNGIYEASASFLEKIQELCHQNDAIFIADEVQCGFARSGKFFAHQFANVQPDIITIAKGMGNGFPVGGVLINEKIQAVYGMLGTTFGGSPLACAATLAVLDIIENENLIENTQKMGQYLLENLKGIKGLKQIRGKGLILGLEFEEPIKDLRNNLLFKHQIFTGNSNNPNTLRVLPSLAIQKEEIDLFLNALKKETN